MSDRTTSRLASASPALFTIGMGLGGLAKAWSGAATHLAAPSLIPDVLFFLTTFITLVVSLVFVIKLVFHSSVVAREMHEVATANFFPGLTISVMLIADWLNELGFSSAFYLWAAAALAHILLALFILRTWIVHNVEIQRANPSMFVPIVGLFVAPLTGASMVSAGVGVSMVWFCFSVALLFWLALFPVMLNRILFHGQLPQQFLPTLSILIAPPALASGATAALLGDFGIASQGFFYIALFQAILLGSMAPIFFKLSFHLSWWAFTFPSAALASVAIMRHGSTPDGLSGLAAVSLLAVSTLVIGYVAYHTVWAATRGELTGEQVDRRG
jgi:tellurite resistance protein